MARRSLSPPITYWNLFKKTYLELFSLSLVQLSNTESISGDEDAISEKLLIILRQVCFQLNQVKTNKEIRVPKWEAPYQPATKDEMTGGKKRKRPDFTCYYFNAHAETPEQQEIPLHVECKLLGSPTSPTWILNKNYVTNGIKRFDCNVFNYGKRAYTGMMIGYIISMSPQGIETEVRSYQNKHLPGYPEIKFDFGTIQPFKVFQEMRRCQVEPLQFELVHLWVDLRKNITNTKAEK